MASLMELFEIANETIGGKKQLGTSIKSAPPTFIEWVVMILILFPLLFAFMIFANEEISVKPAFALIAGGVMLALGMKEGFLLTYQKKIKKGMRIMLSFMNSEKYLILFFFCFGISCLSLCNLAVNARVDFRPL